MTVNLGPLYRRSNGVTDTSHWRGPLLYNYRYDQLNRITGMDAYYGLSQATNSWAGLMPTADFRERVAYDGNGNIQKYKRNNFGETGLPMDSLGYKYITGTNKLLRIQDSADDAIGGGYDLHNQPVNNYAYDSIGNLIKDSSERISAIKWNVYGKIIEIDHKTTTPANPTKNIYYYYDAAGHRIGKKVTRGDTSAVTYTWYVRDASGNVMSTYTASLDSTQALGNADLQLNEQHIYGSNRLGILTANRSADANTEGLNNYISPWTGMHLPYYTGKKQYELTNHLGNVLATISDKKIGVSLAQDSSLIDHYEADVQTAQDYYPFGMIMPGRMLTTLSIPGGTFSGTTQVNGYTLPTDLTLTSRAGNQPTSYVASDLIDLNEGFESGLNDDVTAYIADGSYAGGGNGSNDAGIAGGGKYRYGFNGKENDNEVKGIGDQIDYGMRVYDPRAGRFLSVDPIQAKYPDLTPYQFASNSPIAHIDLDGLEKYHYILTFDVEHQPALKLGSIEDYSVHKVIAQHWDKEGNIYNEYGDVKNPYPQYDVTYSWDSYVATEAIALPIKEQVTVQFGEDPTALNMDNVIETVNSEVESAQDWRDFRQGFAQGLSHAGGISGLIKRSIKSSAESPGKTTGKAADAAHTTPEKSKTATWVEQGKVSKKLVDKYNKLNAKQRPGLPFTKAGKENVREINKEVNGGNMICVDCGVVTPPAKQSKKGVPQNPNESNVDHVKRKREKGSGTPDNGDNRCFNCNVKIKH